jgi:hypothetical protein
MSGIENLIITSILLTCICNTRVGRWSGRVDCCPGHHHRVALKVETSYSADDFQLVITYTFVDQKAKARDCNLGFRV